MKKFLFSFLSQKKATIFPPFFFLVISGLVIFSWFRLGQYYGGGDVGLPTYNPDRIFEITKYVWWEVAAPGIPIPNSVVSTSLGFFLSIFQHLGFSTLLIQATFFLICLFFMGYGMYLFVVSNLKIPKILAIVAGLFYMFNPYMMVQVWHRFIHTTIVLAAVLPFMVLFWQKWIKKRDFKALFFFLLVNFLGVYFYGTIAYILTIWILLLLLTIFEAIFPWKNFTEFVKYVTLFLIGFILWLLTNFWWFIPTFTIGPGLFSQQHSNNESLSTLLEISKQTILPYTLQFLNPFYIFQEAEFGDSYKNIFIKIIPWIATLIIFIGMIKSLKQENNAKWSFLFLCLIFLAKGVAIPFGYPYIAGFLNIFFLGVLRNPFEKLGILLPFAGSILFVIGFSVIANWLKKIIPSNLSKAALFLLLIVIIGYSWPMLTGNIIGRIGKPAFIKVPDSYKDASQLISSNYGSGSILHLPLSRGEGATYKWEYGYNGVDPNQLLFAPLPSISRGFNITRLDDTLTGLSLMFTGPYAYDADKILSLLQAFNVRYVVLHFDMVWQGSDLYDSKEAEKILDKLPFLIRKARIGDLVIYELLSEYYQPKILLTNQVRLVGSDKSQTRMWPWLARLNKGEILTPLTKEDSEVLEKNSNEIMVFPVIENQQLNKFNIPQSGKYELILSNPRIRDIYPGKLDNLDFLINGKLVNLKADFNGAIASFGEIDLSKGNNLISISPVVSNDLVSIDKMNKIGDVKQVDKDTFQLDSNGQNVSYIEWDLGLVSGDDTYQITFEGNFLTGGEYDVQIIQDGDLIINGKQKSRVGKYMYFFQNGYGFKNYSLNTPPLSSATKAARIRVIVDPMGTESLNTPFFANVPTSVQVKNVKVSRILDNTIFLRRTLKQDESVISNTNSIEIIKSNPVQYKGKVRVDEPSFLIFKETYHPDWELVMKNGADTYKPEKHFLSNLYGNAWFIEKTGEYDFTIEFKPQQKVVTGFYLGILGIIIYVAMVVGFRFRKKLLK